MRTPSTRAEFERNFFLLREQIKQGRYHIPQGMALGIEKVRYLPNGRIDFLSVDERARLEANMTAQLSDEMLKEIANSEKRDAKDDLAES
jgi:hypothetical protein